jgi:PmbA protein
MKALIEMVEQTLRLAEQKGATACEVVVSETLGQSITARKEAVETLEFTREKGLGITVHVGHKRGNVGTSDTRPEVIAGIIDKALDIAHCMQEDPCNGLPSVDQLASDFRDLDLYHPWEISPQEAIDLAVNLEKAALTQDPRIKQSDGSHVSTHTGTHVYGNSIGFIHGRNSSRHSLSCVLIADGPQGMQRDYWYDTKRDFHDLANIDLIAKKAAERTTHRLGGKVIPTQSVPVLYDAGMAAGLISHFLSAISGGSLYRKSSFLCESLGETVFSPLVTLFEDPFLPKGLASCNYDAEGVRVRSRNLVNQGVVEGYLLSCYSARRLGLETTGNAGGVHNLIVRPGDQDLFDLFKTMGTGLYVTELMGQGVNIITGDYSRGASGYWIENGVLQYPVEGITIAGNLRDMFKNIVAIGKDIDDRGAIITGSILIEKMMVAGG